MEVAVREMRAILPPFGKPLSLSRSFLCAVACWESEILGASEYGALLRPSALSHSMWIHLFPELELDSQNGRCRF